MAKRRYHKDQKKAVCNPCKDMITLNKSIVMEKKYTKYNLGPTA